MNFDLSKLDDLFNASQSNDNKARDSNPPLDNKNLSKSLLEPHREGEQHKQYIMIERDKELQENALKVYQKYQENIKRSNKLRTEILKNIKQGEDPYNLLLKAVECISLMTGDPHYYNQAKNDLRDIYTSLEYEAPAEQELQEVQERLSKLTEALERETDSSSRERIYKAIQSHKKKEENLLKLIS